MELGLKDKIALITGSSRGIGKATALALAKEGAQVIICGRTEESLRQVQEEIKAIGGKAHLFVLDAAKPDEVALLFSNVVAKIGKLDILVNNLGGVREHAKFHELNAQQWLDAYKFNTITAVEFTLQALPWLKKSDQARIINISSIAGKQPGGFNPHYGAAKAALIHLSKYLANQLGSEKILVNVVCPSTVRGGIWQEHIQDKAQRLEVTVEEAEKIMEQEVVERIPLRRIGLPEDIAGLVVYLASARGRFITGSCICVDGGTVQAVF